MRYKNQFIMPQDENFEIKFLSIIQKVLSKNISKILKIFMSLVVALAIILLSLHKTQLKKIFM